MRNFTDIECVAQTLRGETAAFGELVERYSQRVYALVSGIVGVGGDAEDLTQEIFIKAWKGLSRFSCRSSFATWLYRIAYNAAISSRRAKRTRLVDMDPRRLMELPDEEERQLFSESTIASLERALEALPACQRAVVELHYRQNLTLAEVADVIGSNENNVKVIIHRARRQLAQLIKESEDGE